MTLFPYVRSIYYNLWREFVLPYEIKLNRQIMGLPPIEQIEGQQGASQRRQAQRNGDGGVVGLLQGILDALDPDDEEDDPQVNGIDRIEFMHGEIDAGDNPGADAEIMIELRIEEVEEIREDQEAAIPNRNGVHREPNRTMPPGSKEVKPMNLQTGQTARNPLKHQKVVKTPKETRLEMLPRARSRLNTKLRRLPRARTMGLGGPVVEHIKCCGWSSHSSWCFLCRGGSTAACIAQDMDVRVAKSLGIYAGVSGRPGLLQPTMGTKLSWRVSVSWC